MTMSSALSSGVSGLSANSMKLATISDNIANSNTYGYKRVETEFDSMVLNQVRSTGLYSAGGVHSSSHRIIDQEGALVGTSNPLDIAISGRGFLPVTSFEGLDNSIGKTELMMTRTGGFKPDKDGILRTQSGLVLMGWPARNDGSIPTMPRDTITGLEPVKFTRNQTQGDPTLNVKLGVNLPATDTDAGAVGTPLELKVEYFGNLGTSESLDITFTPDVSAPVNRTNTWRMEIRDSATAPPANLIGVYDIEFDDSQGLGGNIKNVTVVSGGAYDPVTGLLDLTVYPGSQMKVEIGAQGQRTIMTQLDAGFGTTNISKDGSPVGSLSNVEIDENGFIRATYDTGFIKTLYQVPLVDVPNPNGLVAIDNQAFRIAHSSGSYFLWDAGDGPTGSTVGYSREESTTDIAGELTDMIVAQRAYSSNAKVIQTVDEMMQETTNIKR